MKKCILILFFIHLSITNISLANDNIVFVDMDKILTNSKVGKSILSQLEMLNKKTLDYFKKIEKNLKVKEKKLISQKNILASSEYDKNVITLKSEINEYSKNRKNIVKNLNQIKKENINKLLQKVNVILAKYSEKNSISIILQKKFIITGKSDLDISEEILKTVNKDIKEWSIK
jgi:outer membrane protein